MSSFIKTMFFFFRKRDQQINERRNIKDAVDTFMVPMLFHSK